MKRVTGFNYILLTLGAFGGLMLEAIIAYGIEPFLYGRQLVEWSDLQHITHWIITCIMWGIISFLIMNFAKRKYDFDIWRKGKRLCEKYGKRGRDPYLPSNQQRKRILRDSQRI